MLTTTVYRSAILMLLVCFLPCCTQGIQRQLEEQKLALSHMQQRTAALEGTLSQLRRNQADYQSNLDNIRGDIQTLKGSIEENSYTTNKALQGLDARISGLIASLDEKQGQLEYLQKQMATHNRPGAKSPAQVPAGAETDQNLYSRGRTAYQGHELGEARRIFVKLLKTYPGSEFADNAQFWIGKTLVQEKQYEKAIEAFDEVIRKYPQGNKTPDAYYAQALAFNAIDDPLTAQIILETLMKNYPASAAALRAKKKHQELQAGQTP